MLRGVEIVQLASSPLFYSPRRLVFCASREPAPSCKNTFGRNWTRCDSCHVGSYSCSLLPHPFSLVKKVSRPLNQKLCFVLEGSRRGRPLLVLIWIFALLQNSQVASLALFPLLLLANFLERSRNSQNRCLPNRPSFQPIAALLEFRRAGHVPPSRDFRPSALSFVLELQLTGPRICFSV